MFKNTYILSDSFTGHQFIATLRNWLESAKWQMSWIINNNAHRIEQRHWDVSRPPREHTYLIPCLTQHKLTTPLFSNKQRLESIAWELSPINKTRSQDRKEGRVFCLFVDNNTVQSICTCQVINLYWASQVMYDWSIELVAFFWCYYKIYVLIISVLRLIDTPHKFCDST